MASLSAKKKRSASKASAVLGLEAEPSSVFQTKFAEPSKGYTAALAVLASLQRQAYAELEAIAAGCARAPRSAPLETPRKALLSAQVELARMDYMEEAATAALLYASSHQADEAAKKQFDLERPMQEAQHILDCFEELRNALVHRTRKQSTIIAILTLLVVLTYTAFAIPLFLAALLLDPLNAVWAKLFNASAHFYPVDLVQKLYARGCLVLCRINVRWIGLEHVAYDQATLGMFSHASNLDPVIVASGPLAWKWIGKKSLFRIPVIGWILSGLHHIPIERENREKAIASLKRAVEIIHKYKRCVSVSPEGTRSKSGRIQDFKKGAFHTAMQVGVPITPLLVEGAFELWPSGSIFAVPGDVTVTFMRPMPIEPEDTYLTLASKVRRSFFDQLVKSAREQIDAKEKGIKTRRGEEYVDYAKHTLWLPITYAVLYVLYTALQLVVRF